MYACNIAILIAVVPAAAAAEIPFLLSLPLYLSLSFAAISGVIVLLSLYGQDPCYQKFFFVKYLYRSLRIPS